MLCASLKRQSSELGISEGEMLQIQVEAHQAWLELVRNGALKAS